jgi:pyridoxine 5-phosphate synthase
MPNILLCVNVDHIATLRQARGGREPDPIEGAKICESNGADGITVHLREDRRHIQDEDVFSLKKVVKGKLNLEMALSKDIIDIAKRVLPDQITLVPEKREEITTEGGLDVAANIKRIRDVVKEFHELGIIVSLFIEPNRDAIAQSKETGADFIEIHTGTYCNAINELDAENEIQRIYKAAEHALEKGIRVNAGHGLNYVNIKPILKTPGLEELNIGHAMMSRSIFTGLADAVRGMVEIIKSQ